MFSYATVNNIPQSLIRSSTVLLFSSGFIHQWNYWWSVGDIRNDSLFAIHWMHLNRFDLRIVLSVGMIVTAVVVSVLSLEEPLFYFLLFLLELSICCLEWMVTHLFHRLVCLLLDSEWFSSINRLAMCGRNHGELVWKRGVTPANYWCVEIPNWRFNFSRGLIFGIWSACASVGNIFGAALAAAFLSYGYEYPFLVSTVLLFCFAIICLFAIVPSPADVGMYLHLRSFLYGANLLSTRSHRS